MKLDRPPSVANWVRNNSENEISTQKKLIRFERGRPSKSYVQGNKVIQDILVLGLDDETALQSVQQHGNINSREINTEYVKAFLENRESLSLMGHPAYQEFVSPFRISRDLYVPTKPTAVVRRNGKLVPILIFGWKTIPLSLFQRRLMMTVLDDALFSLTDFEHSPAQVIFFPQSDTDVAKRTPVVWNRGDYETYDRKELRRFTDQYVRALSAAKVQLASEVISKTERSRTTPSGPEQASFWD